MKSTIRKWRVEGTAGGFEIHSSCFDQYSAKGTIKYFLSDVPRGWKLGIRTFIKERYWK